MTEIVAGIELMQRTSTDCFVTDDASGKISSTDMHRESTDQLSVDSPIEKQQVFHKTDDPLGGAVTTTVPPTLCLIGDEAIKSPITKRAAVAPKTRRADSTSSVTATHHTHRQKEEQCIGKRCKIAILIGAGLIGLAASIVQTIDYGTSR